MNQPVDNHHNRTIYIVGFGLSLILTLTAYTLVVQELLSRRVLLISITILAITQLIVQLVCFLHLGNESKPRWNLMTFLFMLLVLFIVVFGSLWIMTHLDYHNQTSPQEIVEDEGYSREP
jgi:cytochrome o ubiquinol oxidase subunit IV